MQTKNERIIKIYKNNKGIKVHKNALNIIKFAQILIFFNCFPFWRKPECSENLVRF